MHCPNCGAELDDGVAFCRECGCKIKKRFCRECGSELPDGAKFCPNCGAKVDVSFDQDKSEEKSFIDTSSQVSSNDHENKTSGSTYPSEDHAPHSRTSENQDWKDLSKKFSKANSSKDLKNSFSKVPLIGGALLIILILVFFSRMGTSNKPADEHTGEAKTPASAYALKDKNYEDVQIQFKTNGFSNITLSPQGDLITGWLTKENSVESVSIDGVDNFIAGAWYPKDADVVIRYHSFPTSQSSTAVKSDEENKSDDNELTIDKDAVIPEAPKGEMNGFNTDTNFDFKFHSLTFSMPSYYVVWDDVEGGAEKGFYVEGDDPCDIRFISDDFDYDLSKLSKANLEEVLKSGASSAIEALPEYPDLKIADYKIISVNSMPGITVTIDADKFYRKFACLFNSQQKKFYVIVITTEDKSGHSYLSDFDKIVESATVKTDSSNKKTTSGNDSATKPQATNPESTKQLSKKQPTESSSESVSSPKKAKKKNTSDDTTPQMPVMKGALVETAVEKAKKYGLLLVYEDDMGHSTKCKSLSDSTGGLMIDITYSTDTKEILCASIVTNKLASSTSQKKFVKGMASVLCPPKDTDKVSEWVNTNIGSEKQTSVNGFDYQLSLGPVENIIYDAGINQWENWALSFDE